MAYGGLLIIQHPEVEIGPPGAEIVENGSKVGELGARISLCHGDVPQTESI
jgi:hypothetical protein